MKLKLVAIFSFILLIAGCAEREVRTIVISEIGLDESNIIADTISYSVAILPHDPSDIWMAERLKHVEAHRLVEDIFEKVYSGHLEAFEYFSGELLTPDQVREIESRPDYSRERIEEIVFEETWFFSAEKRVFHKEVHSMVLGYGVYADDGHRRGLKPVFRVKLD